MSIDPCRHQTGSDEPATRGPLSSEDPWRSPSHPASVLPDNECTAPMIPSRYAQAFPLWLCLRLEAFRGPGRLVHQSPDGLVSTGTSKHRDLQVGLVLPNSLNTVSPSSRAPSQSRSAQSSEAREAEGRKGISSPHHPIGHDIPHLGRLEIAYHHNPAVEHLVLRDKLHQPADNLRHGNRGLSRRLWRGSCAAMP